MNALQVIENVVQTVIAGVLTGSIYGLMCVGLALIFGVMRVINFAHGDFMMLGMYAAYYAFGLLGFQTVFGTLGGTYLAILLAVPALFAVGWIVHGALISRVSGTRTAELEGEGHYAQLILTLGIALMLTNGAQMAFGSVTVALRTPLTTAAWEIPFGDISVFVNKSRTIAAAGRRGRHRADQPADHPLGAGSRPARGGGQPGRRDLHGHRRQPGAPHRLRAGRGDHRARRRPAGDQLSVPPARRDRVRDRDVRRRRARRHGQHRRGVLGRTHDRPGAAALDAGAADAAAEHRDLRRLPADRLLPARRASSAAARSAPEMEGRRSLARDARLRRRLRPARDLSSPIPTTS